MTRPGPSAGSGERAMRALDIILRSEPGHAGVYYAEIVAEALGLSAAQAYRLVAIARQVLDDRFPGTQRVGWWERGDEKPYSHNGWPRRNKTCNHIPRRVNNGYDGIRTGG